MDSGILEILIYSLTIEDGGKIKYYPMFKEKAESWEVKVLSDRLAYLNNDEESKVVYTPTAHSHNNLTHPPIFSIYFKNFLFSVIQLFYFSLIPY